MPTESAPQFINEEPSDAAIALVVEACAEVHRRLGPGLPRDAYVEALSHELSARGTAFQRQLTLPVFYRGVRLDAAYPIDVCVLGAVAVDVRAADAVTRVQRAELRAKLRASGLGAGVLVNFHTARFGEGLVIIRRSVPRLRERLAREAALAEEASLLLEREAS